MLIAQYVLKFFCTIASGKQIFSLPPLSLSLSSGEVTLIYRGDVGDYGTLYKTVPVTMNDTYNVMTCYALAGDKDQPVVPQTVLPDPTLYEVKALHIS